jgi:predicted fused transcriptional regulator/phosphomethylpyrimidine kinase
MLDIAFELYTDLIHLEISVYMARLAIALNHDQPERRSLLSIIYSVLHPYI